VLDANAGVEPQTETVWRQADRYKVPRIVFVNKMDKIGADFFNCVQMIKDRTGATRRARALPDRRRRRAGGLIDLVTMEEWVWQGEDLGASWVRQPIRDELRRHGRRMARQDDRERRREWTTTRWKPTSKAKSPTCRRCALIRKGTLALSFVPVLGGSAFKNKGVQPLLNAVIDYLPEPARRGRLHGLQAG
jgi:elongation factor G